MSNQKYPNIIPWTSDWGTTKASTNSDAFDQAMIEMNRAREERAKKEAKIAREKALDVMHDVTVTPGEETIIEWWYERPWGKYKQRHVVKKKLTMDDMKEICKKVQGEWAKDVQNGLTIEELLMMDLL